MWEKLKGICEKRIANEKDETKKKQEYQNLLLLYQAQEVILTEQEVALVNSEVDKRAGMAELSSANRKYLLTCKVFVFFAVLTFLDS